MTAEESGGLRGRAGEEGNGSCRSRQPQAGVTPAPISESPGSRGSEPPYFEASFTAALDPLSCADCRRSGDALSPSQTARSAASTAGNPATSIPSRKAHQAAWHPHEHHPARGHPCLRPPHPTPPRSHPTCTGAEPEHPQPGLGRAAATSCSHVRQAWPRAAPAFQAAAVAAGERRVGALAASRSAAGSLAPAPRQRQLRPGPGARAEATLLSLPQH